MSSGSSKPCPACFPLLTVRGLRINCQPDLKSVVSSDLHSLSLKLTHFRSVSSTDVFRVIEALSRLLSSLDSPGFAHKLSARSEERRVFRSTFPVFETYAFPVRLVYRCLQGHRSPVPPAFLS